MTFNMKRLWFLMFLMQFTVCWNGIKAQDLKFRVAECYLDQQDMTAHELAKDDGDGAIYAIIKVSTDNEDDDLSQFQFDFNYLKSSKEMRDGELWVFVQRNAKNVTIRREGYKTVRYSLPQTVKAGKTYRMVLSVEAPTLVQRVVQFKVTPANEGAIVKVKAEGSNDNYQLWGTVDAQGCIDRLMPTGVYLYEVSADSYQTAQGKLTLENGADNHVEQVTLKPNFGYLVITDDYGINGAEVYINNRKVGTVPYKSGRMECRNDYQLMISNGELYKTFERTFEIRLGETTTLSPRLESNFAESTIQVGNDAEIFINGVSKGKSIWSGPLRAGVYDVECRLPHHVSSKKQILVKSGEAETFVVDSPLPIEGSLYVTSTPSGAQISLDGKDLGLKTPKKVDHVLTGEHRVSLVLDQYQQVEQTVHVKQKEITTVEALLSPADGQKPGKPSAPKTPSGKQAATTFYLQPSFQLGSNMGVGLAVGTFLSHFNIEAYCLYGLAKETAYWNNGSNSLIPIEESYQNIQIGAKIGWGISAGSRLRLTPQVGAGLLAVSASESEGYAIKGSVGVRADYRLSKSFALVVAPEYGLALSKSNVYDDLSAVSSKIKGWANGFNCLIGVHFSF